MICCMSESMVCVLSKNKDREREKEGEKREKHTEPVEQCGKHEISSQNC